VAAAKANQTITFNLSITPIVGQTFTVSAASSSGLTVSFAASGGCFLIGTSVTITSAGACTITASQAGNDDYNAAPNVARTIYAAYTFVGFSQPVDNNGTVNAVKAGQAIPLKWRLLDFSGNPVLNLTSATVNVQDLNCSLGTTADLLEEVAAGASGLQNLGNGYYQLNWKSPVSYAKSCKTMTLNLGEGPSAVHAALFTFTK
jgi:hypothetical protein